MHNFGTFGVQIGYDLFDGGKRNATIGQQRAQLAKAEENLAHITEEVELRVQTAYNKLERTRQIDEGFRGASRGAQSSRDLAYRSSFCGECACCLLSISVPG